MWDYSGKGTPRRKVKSKPKNSGVDDKKLQTALKKINVQPIQAIEEVNMFKADGNVIHFAAPKGMYIRHSTWQPRQGHIPDGYIFDGNIRGGVWTDEPRS